MEHNNPYKTPEANLIEEKSEDLAVPYYIVGKKKAWALFIATVGMYQLYWFYKHWTEIKHHEGSNIWPVPRAIFSIFFCHGLFKKIKQSHEESGLASAWVPATSAAVYVGFTIISNISDRVIDHVEPMLAGIIMLVGVAAMFVSVYAMMQAQNHVNEIAMHKHAELNENFTWANYLWLLLGIVLWIFVAIGIVAIFNPALFNI